MKEKQPRTPRARPDPIEKLWLAKQFCEIDEALEDLKRQNVLILDRVAEIIAAAVGSPNSQVIPELEEIIGKVGRKADIIDAKVR